ncbi:phosphoribosylamine--glycine ligase [Candidatus Sumerlaeota bacterium]|nr:phosphoribosylamine--glycine ligase [Candidatus Sumerlaeota bacterium]
MKVLVTGNGGREHALVWKISKSPKVENIFCPGGNAGISELADTTPVNEGEDFSGLIDYAIKQGIDLTVVGPEAPLASGIVDAFQNAGLRIFGPDKKAAMIESSKFFAKEVMISASVPTGSAQVFSKSSEAIKYLDTRNFPIVIKADGLAAGKGVILTSSRKEAESAIGDIMDKKTLGDAGCRILIEEFLSGEEASLLAFTDGKTILPMDSAQDHKPIGDGDTGPNTGGMGAYSPAPVVTPEIFEICVEKIFKPTLSELGKRGILYKGVLYAGLMIDEKVPRVLEFNCRFGDPETQALLPRLKNDLVEIMEAIIDGRLREIELVWNPKPAVCVVLASGGYPGSYEKGKVITGLETITQSDDQIVFHAGTSRKNGAVVTSGGRVLGVTSLADSLPQAIDNAYATVAKIHFDKMYFRKDIALKALKGNTP